MSARLRKVIAGISILLSSLAFASPAFAAAPDGLGPWADTVVSSAQGLRNDGTPVLAIRSNPSSALGVAEQTNVDGTFFSLGFGGTLTLGFDNGISGGSMVFESTNLPYPTETAKVEFSSNGTTWVNAGSVSRTGTVAQPEGVSCAKFVRITDTSNKASFEPTADGYDVDGVQAQGNPCTPPTGNNCTCPTDVIQSNNSGVTTIIQSSASTGGNKGNKNTGGNVSITTGNASSSATVTVTGNTNTVTGSGCCCGGSTNVTISGNGAGSHNSVNINSPKMTMMNFNLIKH